ncbi:MAG: START domain-containing protein, partial [Thermodesulfobacteriota bacterium]|nr:START domain-containing protein [Thermodesulfobacteriota bacterium]
DGIIGYTRPTPKTSVDEVKAIGVVNASVAVIEALLRDVPAQTEYMFLCIEALKVDIPGLESIKDSFYVYNKTNMTWPIHDRDVVAKTEYMIDKSTGILHVQAHRISTDFRTQNKKVIRIPITEVKYILTPIGKDKTEVTYQILADPGGKLPSSLVNMLSKNLGVKTIAGIREMVKKDKYKNVKSVTTTTPWIR